jgi:hypothetical protein
MSNKIPYRCTIFPGLAIYVVTKTITGELNMDKQTMADKIMETVVNGLAAIVMVAGIPYFLFILYQFLLW